MMKTLVKNLLRSTRHRYHILKSDYGKKVFSSEYTNRSIKNLLISNSPCMITRLGSVELGCIVNSLAGGDWSNKTKVTMRNNAGFFPIEGSFLKEFSELYMRDLREVDLLGIWYNNGEDYVCKNYCGPNVVYSHLRDLEPYYHENPWTHILEQKKVLVIHPFENSIIEQYKKRELLFTNKLILPEFELITLKAVQTISGNTQGYNNWFEALYDMCKQIDNIEYDIAIIGCGAYGLPIAAHIKQKGKKAIHLGGATQLLFGIKGTRWDDHPVISKLYNEYWIRPSIDEQPKSFNKVENGCYW